MNNKYKIGEKVVWNNCVSYIREAYNVTGKWCYDIAVESVEGGGFNIDTSIMGNVIEDEITPYIEEDKQDGELYKIEIGLRLKEKVPIEFDYIHYNLDQEEDTIAKEVIVKSDIELFDVDEDTQEGETLEEKKQRFQRQVLGKQAPSGLPYKELYNAQAKQMGDLVAENELMRDIISMLSELI